MALRMFSDRGRGREVWYRCQVFVSSFPSLRATHEISLFFPLSAMLCVYTVQHAPSLFSPGKPCALGHLEEEGRKERGILNLGDRGPPGAAGRGKREKKVGSLFSPPLSSLAIPLPPPPSLVEGTRASYIPPRPYFKASFTTRYVDTWRRPEKKGH